MTIEVTYRINAKIVAELDIPNDTALEDLEATIEEHLTDHGYLPPFARATEVTSLLISTAKTDLL